MAPYYGDDSAWTTWTSTSASCSPSSTASSGDQIWDYWQGNITSSTAYDTSYSGNIIWYEWNDEAEVEWVGDAPSDIPKVKGVKRLARTQKYWQRLEKRRIKARRKQMAKAEFYRRQRNAAEEKAKELLLDLIGEDQLKIYEETGRIFVKGRKHDYVVQKTGMVRRIEKDRIQDLCIHLRERTRFPETDNVIALKLLIEANEKTVEKMANKHGFQFRDESPIRKLVGNCACLG